MRSKLGKQALIKQKSGYALGAQPLKQLG